MKTKVFFKIEYKKSMAIIVIAFFLTINNHRLSVVAQQQQELMHNEEMTTTNLDFVDIVNNNNSEDEIQLQQNLQDIIRQQQQQQQQKSLSNSEIIDDVTNNRSSISDSNKILLSAIATATTTTTIAASTDEEEITQKNDFPVITTMVPLPDYIQMFSSLSSSVSTASAAAAALATSSLSTIDMINNADEDDYIKENESRSSTSFESNETSASYSMKNSVYAPQKHITTIDDIDNDDVANNLSISIQNNTISNNNNNNNNNTLNITSDNIPSPMSSSLSPSLSLYSSPIASPLLSPYIPSLSSSSPASSSTSGEDFNQSSQILMMTDGLNEQENDSSNFNDNNHSNNNNSNNNYNNNYPQNDENNDDDHNHNLHNSDEDNIGEQIPVFDIDQIESGTTTLTSVPTVRTKQGKQIQIIKLLPHEALRNFIEDAYIRMPLAALIDTSSDTLEKSKALWKDALRPNAALDIVLLAFNASGVSVTYHFQNTRTLLAGLDSIKESTTGGNAFFAIIRACELIPYDSAVFISTSSIPADTNLAKYAAITLLKKRIRLYLIWFGDNTYSENETQEVTGGVLGEVAIRSGGEILHIGNDTKYEEDNMLTLISDNYRGNQELEIPVETTLSNLHIKVDGVMKAATLVTPNGEINLKNLNLKKTTNNKMILKTMKNNTKELDILISFRKINSPTQIYFKLIPEDGKRNFNVLVEAKEHSESILDYETSDDEIDDDNLQRLNLLERSERKLNIENKESSISHEDIRFPDNDNIDNNDNIELVENFKDQIEDIAKQQQINPIQSITRIDVGIQSQLLVTPGMIAQIHFEVTNTRSEPVFHNIRVTDEKGYLLSLNPRSINWLPPGQTATVVLSVIIPSGTPQGTRDKITFTCQGYGEASQTVELRVISPSEVQDTTPPTVTWVFGTRCDGQYSSGSCSQRIWNLEITAQDWETGILRIESNPNGIIPRIPFTVGTTESVRASYSATCCQPRVTITVYDLAGNQRTSTIDVRDILLTDASIAAIVLGVLLLIALIVILIIATVWCCKKRKRSQDISSAYRSHAERSR